jgi:hypothetical protein
MRVGAADAAIADSAPDARPSGGGRAKSRYPQAIHRYLGCVPAILANRDCGRSSVRLFVGSSLDDFPACSRIPHLAAGKSPGERRQGFFSRGLRAGPRRYAIAFLKLAAALSQFTTFHHVSM